MPSEPEASGLLALMLMHGALVLCGRMLPAGRLSGALGARFTQRG